MDRAASESPVGAVALVELHPGRVLVEAGALPLCGGGLVAAGPRHARGADEGRQEVGGAIQREPLEQRPGHRPGQEREEVAGEDRHAEEQAAAGGGEEERAEEEDGDGEEEELEPGASHGHGGEPRVGPRNGLKFLMVLLRGETPRRKF